jgi:hypothetical protein
MNMVRRICYICRSLTLPSHLEETVIQTSVGSSAESEDVCLLCAKAIKTRDAELDRVRKEERIDEQAREDIKVTQNERSRGSGDVSEVYEAITVDELTSKSGETLDIF